MRIAIGSVIVSLALAGPATAAPGWLNPFDVASEPVRTGDVRVAVNDAGHAVVAWSIEQEGVYRVRAAARDADGVLSQPQTLSSTNDASPNALAVDAAGNAIVMWDRDDSVGEFAVRAPGGTFGPAQPLAPGEGVDSLDAVVHPSGEAIVAWVRNDQADRRIRYATGSSTGGFSDPQYLSLPGADASAPDLAMNAAGAAVLTWIRDGVIQASFRPPGGGFGEPIGVPDAGAGVFLAGVESAIDDAGNVVLMWNRIVSFSPFAGTTYWSARPAGGAFTAPAPLSRPDTTGGGAVVKFDGAGNAVAIWREIDDATAYNRIATRPPGGVFPAGVNVTPPNEDAALPALDVTPAGDVLVAYRFLEGDDDRVFAVVRPAGGTFGAPQPLSPAGADASSFGLDADTAGNALAAWTTEGTPAAVLGSIRDATPPLLRDLQVPATGTVGVPIEVSVSPFDRWSRVAPVGWDFGDGGRATGSAATHVYEFPGDYAIRADGVDAAGNAASASGQITIGALPVLPPLLSDLAIAPRKFRAAKRRRGPSIARTRRTARLTYQLDDAARVVFRVQKRARGRLVGRTCVKPERANRKRRRCARWKNVRGRFAVDSQAGHNELRFTGRMRNRRLRPGRYRLVATPRVGDLKGDKRRETFRIVAR